jgi:hypothetical protein
MHDGAQIRLGAMSERSFAWVGSLAGINAFSERRRGTIDSQKSPSAFDVWG